MLRPTRLKQDARLGVITAIADPGAAVGSRAPKIREPLGARGDASEEDPAAVERVGVMAAEGEVYEVAREMNKRRGLGGHRVAKRSLVAHDLPGIGVGERVDELVVEDALIAAEGYLDIFLLGYIGRGGHFGDASIGPDHVASIRHASLRREEEVVGELRRSADLDIPQVHDI